MQLRAFQVATGGTGYCDRGAANGADTQFCSLDGIKAQVGGGFNSCFDRLHKHIEADCYFVVCCSGVARGHPVGEARMDQIPGDCC